jgi:hypothetical protein
MEFHIKLTRPIPDLGVIEDAIRAVDPSAQVDIDPEDRKLRVAAWCDSNQLVALMCEAGCPVDPLQIIQLPSTCCGGCGG